MSLSTPVVMEELSRMKLASTVNV